MQEILMNRMSSRLNLQHNCNRSTDVMQTILNYTVKNVNIVLLQELWIENNNILISHSAFTKVAFTE